MSEPHSSFPQHPSSFSHFEDFRSHWSDGPAGRLLSHPSTAALSTRYKKGDVINQIYRVHVVLQGGMGEVYVCEEITTGNFLALKTFKSFPASGSRASDEFSSEALAWVHLISHPNIVTCHFLDYFDGVPFLALELVLPDEHGRTSLRSWMSGEPLPLRFALEVAIDIARGMIHACQQLPGLVHRDLKPENILLASDAVAKVTDFGLAVVNSPIWEEATRTESSLAGTPLYISPEIWLGSHPPSEQSDLYAFGCILQEMLTGQHPLFSSARDMGNDLSSIERIRAKHLFDPPAKLNQSVPAVVRDIVLRCLSKKPTDRFSSFTELEQYLVAAFGTLFSSAPPLRHHMTISESAELYFRGKTLFRIGMTSAAIEAYSAAIAINPGHVDAWRRRGEAYLSLGNIQMAKGDIERALSTSPSSPACLAEHAKLLSATGDADAAVRELETAISLSPATEIHWLYEKLGETLIKAKRHLEAVKAYDLAVSSNPNCAHARTLRGDAYREMFRYEEALRDFDMAIKQQPDKTDAFKYRGAVYAKLGRPEEALKDLDTVLLFRPNDPFALAERAAVLLSQSRPEEAAEGFRRALELKPNDIWARNRLAEALVATGQIEDAISSSEETIALGGTSHIFNSYQLLVTLLWENRRFDEAEEQMLRLSSHFADPENLRQLNEEFRWYFERPQVDEDTSIFIGLLSNLLESLHETTRVQESEKGKGLFHLARSMWELGFNAWSEIVVAEAVQEEYSNWPYFNLAAAIQATVGDTSQALESANRAVELSGSEPEALVTRARLWEVLGDRSHSLGDFEAAIASGLDNADALREYGAMNEEMGNYARALSVYEMAAKTPNLQTSDLVEILIDCGSVCNLVGTYERAIEFFSQAIELDSSSVLGWNNRGNSFHYLARYAEAIADRQQALKLAPAYDQAWFNLGNSYFENGDYAPALTAYSNALEYRAELPLKLVRRALLRMATILAGDGQSEAALRIIDPLTKSSDLEALELSDRIIKYQ